MPVTMGAVLAAAGVDPYELADQVGNGEPESVVRVATAYDQAAEHARTTLLAAQRADATTAEAYLVNGSAVHDAATTTAATRAALGDGGEHLTGIARTLRRVAADLSTAQTGVAGQLDGMQAELSELNGLGLTEEGLLAAASGIVRARGGAIATLVDAYDQSVRAGVRVLAEYGIVPPDPVLGPPMPPPPPPAGASPEQNHRWWQNLTPDQQDQLIRDDPGLVGNLDGVPATARDDANRAVLTDVTAQADRIRARLAELDAQGPQFSPGFGPTPADAERWSLEAQLAAFEEHRPGIEAIQTRLDSPTLPQGFLLGFEPDVGNGWAIVASGNPDTADNVVTAVPGTTARLGSVEGDIAKIDAVVRAAEAAAPSESTAGIAWFGYDAPQTIPEAGLPGYADDAQPHLRTFQEGLRVTHEGPPSHNTVLAHSYGSTVVGHTARDGTLDADALVFAGSPGVGVEHVEQLHRPPGTVYSTTSENDEIALTNLRWSSPDGDPIADALAASLDAHGRNPSSPEFGAEVFRANPEGGHSDYWLDYNTSLDSFGLIAVGKEPLR